MKKSQIVNVLILLIMVVVEVSANSLDEGVDVTIQSIGYNALCMSSGDFVISKSNSPKGITAGAFKNASSCKLIVPQGTRDMYAQLSGWEEFGTIEEDESLTSYMDNEIFTATINDDVEMTFMVLSSVDKTVQVGDGTNTAIDTSFDGDLVVPSEINGLSVIKVADKAFEECQNLNSVELGEGIITIGSDAFSRARIINSVSLPTTLKSIDKNAFWYGRIGEITLPTTLTFINTKAFESANIGVLNIPYADTPIMHGSSFNTYGSQLFSYTTIGSLFINRAFTKPSYETGNNMEYAPFYNATIEELHEGENINGNDWQYGSCTVNHYYPNPTNDYSQCNSFRYYQYGDKSQNSTVKYLHIQEGVTNISAIYSASNLILPSSLSTINNDAFSSFRDGIIYSITSYIQEPFDFETSALNGLNYSSNCILTIPYGTRDVYISAGWTEEVFKGGIVELSSKSDQSLSLSEIPIMTYGDAAYSLPLTTEEGLAIEWGSSDLNVATVSGNTLMVKGAGSTTITATQAGNDNYNPFEQTFTLTVNKAQLTITADDKTKTAGAANPAFTISYSGFKYNDNASSLTTQPTAASEATTSSPAGTYPITVSGGSSDNYEFNYVNGTLTVTAKNNQTISLSSIPVMTYGDGSYNLPSATDQGLALTWSSNNTSVATVSGNTLTVKGAGEASVTAANDGDTTHNPFSKSYTLTVDKAVLTVTADDCSRMEGYANPTFTISYSGFKYNDNVSSLTTQPTAASEATNSSPAGIYPISVSGASADNYSITYVNGSLTVLEYDENLPIQFADPNVKSICVSNWDSNGDGELSYEEAAAVTDIGNLFTANDVITSFDELQYFTGLSSIRNRAFFNCVSLSSIIIPEGVTSIGEDAFAGCNSLPVVNNIRYAGPYLVGATDKTLPTYTIREGTRYIGISAFQNCSNLVEITIPEGVTSIGNYAFENCSSLTSITIPDGVTSIGEYAFRGCNGLTSITIPEGVTSIGKYAFSGCSSLVEITISEGVTSIGNYAFENCSSLTNITIPESVISIGEYAFSGCSSLPVENNIRYADTYLVEAINKTLSTYTIKDDTRFIGRYAFKECTALTSITIPEGVTSIGYGAFSGCSNLVEITIPESVISIGNCAFSGCSSLPVENNIRYAGPYLVEAADKTLSTYTIREGTRFIGTSAFNRCSSLTSITIPEGVTSIQGAAFLLCSSLTSITIPDGVTSIGSSAFRYCSLTSITIPESVNSIGNAAFVDTRIQTVKVCNSTPFPYDSPFSLNSIRLPVIVLIVPASALSAYKTAKGWKDFDYIVCEEDYLNSLKISDLTVEHGAEINLPVSMTNPEQITAVEFDLWVPNCIKLLGCSMTERKNGHEINYVQNGNDCHVTIFSLTSSAIDGNDGELLNLKLLAESEGSFKLRIQNIEFSTKEGERRNPPYSRSATVTINDIPLGDVNGDGEVTITDAVSIVNHRLDRTPVRFISVAADLNADNEITITDAVRIVNMILSDQSNAKLRTESAISLPEPQ